MQGASPACRITSNVRKLLHNNEGGQTTRTKAKRRKKKWQETW